LTAGRMTDGGVMHQLGRSQLAGRLPSLVHNSESGIRAGVRGPLRRRTNERRLPR
jgi:hypothetical protein